MPVTLSVSSNGLLIITNSLDSMFSRTLYEVKYSEFSFTCKPCRSLAASETKFFIFESLRFKVARKICSPGTWNVTKLILLLFENNSLDCCSYKLRPIYCLDLELVAA